MSLYDSLFDPQINNVMTHLDDFKHVNILIYALYIV